MFQSPNFRYSKTINPCLIFLSLFLFIGLTCSENQQIPLPASFPTSTETTLLFFKKEHKIEIWTYATPKKLIRSLSPQKKKLDLPIGQSFPNADNKQSLIPDSEAFNVKELLVFPSDSRLSGQFKPCFACPHPTGEIYAKLELLLKAYPLRK